MRAFCPCQSFHPRLSRCASAGMNFCYNALTMQFIPIKTRKFLPPKDNVFEELDKRMPKLKNGDVILIASKILAIHQGRCVKIIADDKTQKHQLVKKEADYHLPGYMLGDSE